MINTNHKFRFIITTLTLSFLFSVTAHAEGRRVGREQDRPSAQSARERVLEKEAARPLGKSAHESTNEKEVRARAEAAVREASKLKSNKVPITAGEALFGGGVPSSNRPHYITPRCQERCRL